MSDRICPNVTSASFPLLNQHELTNSDMCAICHDDLHEGRKLCCGHAFHSNCLDALLTRYSDCPVCRRKIEVPFDFDCLPRFRAILERSAASHKAYQYRGVQWLVSQEQRNRGGLLADEMGLGKTISLIGLMVENFVARTLIIVPVALLSQWRDTIFHFTGHRALIYHSSHKKPTLAQLTAAPVVLSTYGIISVSSKRNVRSVLHDITWDRVLFDEAHHLRNKNTSKYCGAALLQSPIKWMVTGTPMQNRRADIMSLASLLGIDDVELVTENMLRRTKRDVGSELLPVSDETIYVPWSNEEEKRLAEDIHAQCQRAFFVSSRSGGVFGEHFGKHQIVALTRAKQICTAPSILNRPIRKVFEEGHVQVSDPRAQIAYGVQGTSKLSAVLDHMLGRMQNSRNKIVFCTYHQEIDFLKQGLVESGVSVFVKDGRHNGALPPSPDSESNSCQVLILQMQSCCEGLNLQAYSEVYFVTPHWNPFLEDQAVARCHRIGQTQRVQVFRFLMRGDNFRGMDYDEDNMDFEEGMPPTPDSFDTAAMELQQSKRMLADFILTTNQWHTPGEDDYDSESFSF